MWYDVTVTGSDSNIVRAELALPLACKHTWLGQELEEVASVHPTYKIEVSASLPVQKLEA
jgi:hypothetical protein